MRNSAHPLIPPFELIMDKNRSILIESDWIEFLQAGKPVSGFGITPESAGNYKALIADWLCGCTFKKLKAEIRIICEG